MVDALLAAPWLVGIVILLALGEVSRTGDFGELIRAAVVLPLAMLASIPLASYAVSNVRWSAWSERRHAIIAAVVINLAGLLAWLFCALMVLLGFLLAGLAAGGPG